MANVLVNANALWSKQQIRVLVLVSLLMQVVLIFFAPRRKTSGNKLVRLLLWAVYLVADYVATLALGSILANMMNNTGVDSTGKSLTAFWANFLLLHLGGPDSITSYSLEDNELWWRHFIGVVTQVSVAYLVLVQSNLQSTRLLVPSILIFLVGTTKFGERTLALRAATMEQIKRRLHGSLAFHFHIDDENSDESEVRSEFPAADLIFGDYILFCQMRPYMVNRINMSSETLFWGRRDFRSISMCLSFFYDSIHTKAILVHCLTGRVIRLASLVFILIALIFFRFSEKQGHDSIDVIITYILLSAALFLDICSIILLVASNWTIGYLMILKKSWSRNLAEFICKVTCRGKCNNRFWSGLMGQYNLVQSTGEEGKYKIRDPLNEEAGRHIISNPFKSAWGHAEVSETLENMMIEYVKCLVQGGGKDVEKMARSSWKARTLDQYGLYLSSSSRDYLKSTLFDQYVVAWHVATEICYIDGNGIEQGRNGMENNNIQHGRNDSDDSNTEQGRNAIHSVSNYLMYLLLKRLPMMPSEILESILKVNIQIFGKHSAFRIGDEEWHTNKDHNITTRMVGLLLKDLRDIGDSRLRWKLIRDGLMEMLTYVALNCSLSEHARALSRGGELLTHHWLLLFHHNFTNNYFEAYQDDPDDSE